ncbi:MAG: C40 family peptidase [Sphingomonadales bacterium]|jgi:hypothetical protein
MKKQAEFYSPKAKSRENGLDPRTHAIRPDLADHQLKDLVEADRYVDFSLAHALLGRTAILDRPQEGATQVSELLFNEAVHVFERGDDYAWVQCVHDDYVGYVDAHALDYSDDQRTSTHRLSTAISHIYPSSNLKTRPIMEVYGGTTFNIAFDAPRDKGFVEIKYNQWIYEAHLTQEPGDILTIAKSYLGAPYLWGGRTLRGIDCSGLVQMALMRAGLPCPRDSDMQAKVLGEPIEGDLRVGDIIFFPGHVGIMVDETHLLHANAYHMAVTIDPLEEVIKRIRRDHQNPVTAQKRLIL